MATHAKAKVTALYLLHEMLLGGCLSASQPAYHPDAITSVLADPLLEVGAIVGTGTGAVVVCAGTALQRGAAPTRGCEIKERAASSERLDSKRDVERCILS